MRTSVLWISFAAILIVAISSVGAEPTDQRELFHLGADQLVGSEGAQWVPLPREDWHLADGTEGVATWWPRGETPPAGWDGTGRFTLEVDVAADLVGRPLALRIEQNGAFELRIDGVALAQAGSLPAAGASSTASNIAAFVPRNLLQPIIVVFERAGRHEVELNYANPRVAAFQRNNHSGGFRLWMATAEHGLRTSFAIDTTNRRYQGLFTGIFLAVAMLHLLLFAFWPETRENLWFALLCGAVAALEWCLFNYPLAPSPTFLLWVEPAMNTAGLVMCLAALRFVYGVFRPDLFVDGWPKRLSWPLPCLLLLAVVAAVWPARFTLGVFVVCRGG